MANLYIQDSTIGKYVTFDTVPQLVTYLNQLIPRAFKVSREEYVQNLLDLGYGYDDGEGVMVTRAMGEQFDIGVIRDGKYIKTDVHEIVRFKDDGYGN
jgi:hypothetical protein